MANVVREQKLIDSTRKALVKYVVLSDGTATANTRLLDASGLAYSLNANGQILGVGTDIKSDGYVLTINRIFGYSKLAGYVSLKWEGDANSEIVTFGGNGQFDFNFAEGGTAGSISNPEANATGDILYTTVAPTNGDTFTLFVELKKDGGSYDQGQTADPTAFNR